MTPERMVNRDIVLRLRHVGDPRNRGRPDLALALKVMLRRFHLMLVDHAEVEREDKP